MTRPKPIIAPGDVLSYSSGSTNRDPHGFRITQKGGNLLGLIKMRWPGLVATFGDRMPIVINTYPAHIGSFDFGVTVDSYLSYTTASRALHLASVEKLPVMLLGQSLVPGAPALPAHARRAPHAGLHPVRRGRLHHAALPRERAARRV
jgi:hypothetical protein